jgi:rhamnosyltransferase
MIKEVFIIGSKGIPAKYGGFETFVHKLVENQKNKKIHYNIACLGKNNLESRWNGARCFNVKLPNIGNAKAVLYDLISLRNCINYIRKNKITDSVIYILACRIGPFMWVFKRKLYKYKIKVFLNPDGNEWRREKWNYFIKKYWKLSEKLMVKNADLVICDSKVIEDYIKEEYKKYLPKTRYISYGADIFKDEKNSDELIKNWYIKKNLKKNEYYLMVGRFVPENNFEFIIKEYLKTKTDRDLVIITNYEKNKLFSNILENTKFDKDNRIKFVGTVYNQDAIKKIRENAFAYIHGHEVGGTNPTLLESMATTNLNIVLDVAFNREVCKDCAMYFSKDKENNKFSYILEEAERLSDNQIKKYGDRAKKRIGENYSWSKIVNNYENLFLK